MRQCPSSVLIDVLPVPIAGAAVRPVDPRLVVEPRPVRVVDPGSGNVACRLAGQDFAGHNPL
eukprot:1366835-Heterocapsa_arctica.AAC.1